MAQLAQYKVNQFAKDLNLKSKDILDILESKKISVKSQATLDAAQFDVLFEDQIVHSVKVVAYASN